MTDEQDFLSTLAPVATGNVNGDRWTLRAGGTPDNFFTIITVDRADGTTVGGGFGGGPAHGSSSIDVSTGMADNGPMWLVARTERAVSRIIVEFDREPDLELPPQGDPSPLGLRFFATLLHRDARLSRVSALDDNGRKIGEYTGVFVSQQRHIPSVDQPTESESSVSWHPAGDG